MFENAATLTGAIVLLATNIVTLLINLSELRKVKKEVKDLEVVIKDTKEIREALRKPFEGNWRVQGHFSKFQGKPEEHFSTGEVNFDWIPEKNHYDITYVYSVRKAKSSIDEITAFCRGKMLADAYGGIDPKQKTGIELEIISRTATAGYDGALSKHFTLKDGTLTKTTDGRPQKFSFVLNNNDTVGEISFVV